MKKIVSLKEIMIILVSVLLITFSTTVFASDLVLGDGNNNNNDNNNNATTITGNEYNEAQNNNTNNTNNENNTNNTNTNDTSLPQTGIEDYGTGILLVMGIASAIFAYKKINEYRNI